MKRLKLRLLLLSATVATQSAALPINPAVKDYWPRWDKSQPASTQTIDHHLWQSFITRYVSAPHNGLSRINYAAVTPIDKKRLADYLKTMADTPISSYNRQQQIAYWINLYNALVVHMVLEHYPIDNIVAIDPSPFAENVGPWDYTIINVGNTGVSLNSIRNRIIRPIFKDNRILYALCNSAIGAPNIRQQAYDGEHIEAQLKAAAEAYVNSPRGVQFIQGRLFLSQLYRWYSSDFGGSSKRILQHLQQFAHGTLKKHLQQATKIAGYQYNWHLNQTLPKPNV